jgi:hypothetical protein
MTSKVVTENPAGRETNKYEENLKRKPHVPGSVRELFDGRDARNTQSFVDLITSNDAVEIDVLCKMCQMSDAEFSQYIALIPESEAHKEKIETIVIGFIEKIRPKFPEIVKASIKGEKKNSLVYVHNQIMALIHAVSFGMPGGPYRVMLIEEFQRVLLVNFFREIDKLFQLPEYKQHSKIPMDVRKRINAQWKRDFNVYYPPSTYFSSRNKLRTCLTNARFKSNLDKAFPSEAEAEKLDNELKQQFEEIVKLAQYRKVLFTPWQSEATEETKAAIMGGETLKIPASSPSVCHGMIILNPLEELQLPKITKSKTGRGYITVAERDGVINFSVNKRTGEICYWGNSNICLNDDIPQAQYIAIKKRIYAMLLDHLRTKEPDIEDLFAKHVPPKAIEIVEDTQGMVEKTIVPETEDIEEIAKATGNEITDTIIEGESPEISEVESVGGPEEPARTEEEIEVRKKQFRCIERLKGLKGREALKALRKLLGKPYSVKGSHYNWRSERNGKILPFPIKTGKDITFPIFVANLQGLGYGLDEFCEKLY